MDGLISELTYIHRSILLLDHGSEELLDQRSSLKKNIYALDLNVKQFLHEQTTSQEVFSGVSTRVQLSKISVPIFSGNIMQWSSLWEQFDVSIHQKESLQDVKKLAYLRYALKSFKASNLMVIANGRKSCQSHLMPGESYVHSSLTY